MQQDSLKVEVLVASYARPTWLERCLESLLKQTRLPDRIVDVTREGDSTTQDMVREFIDREQSVCFIMRIVRRPGVLAANNAAFPSLIGDIVAFLDDDSTAPPEWLKTCSGISLIHRWERWEDESKITGTESFSMKVSR